MSFTYDVTTDRGKVRLLIPDRDAANQIFSDAEIDAYLVLGDNNNFRAAALALGTVSTDEALTLKYIKTEELETDGSKPATVILQRAKLLDARADALEAATEDDAEGFFDFADMNVDAFSAREIYSNALLREGN